MKKKRKKISKKTKSNPAIETSGNTRRDFLSRLRNGAIGLAVLGGGGYFAVSKVQASMAEQDLSKIGKGTPSIVQIHDPQCPVCLALQKETRKALQSFQEEDFVYLVANIRGKEGGDFANKYLVPHVTLLLFDGKGELSNVLRGPNTSDFLRNEFEKHLSGAS